MLVAERMRAAFETAGRTVMGRYVGATVSVGVAAHGSAANIDALLARADAALYAAKANGRNRVEGEGAMFDMFQTSEPDPIVEEAVSASRSDRLIRPRPRAEVSGRRDA
jgi:predicted signal transduction protein with EAL and GGDEF domain